VIFLHQSSLLYLILIFAASLFLSQQSISFVFAQSQNLEEHLGLFGNGNNSLLNDVFNNVKDSVVQITTEYQDPNYPGGLYDTTGGSPIPMKFGSVYWDMGKLEWRVFILGRTIRDCTL
jgi:hypothetical protein